MILRQNLQDMIAIMIVLDSLHKNFDTTRTNLLEASDKIIDQIQSILQSKKAKKISTQVTEDGIGDLTIAFRNKNVSERMLNSNDKYYNYEKLGHFEKD